jgi:hypothetical protein
MRRLRHPSLVGLLGTKPVSDRWGWDRGTPVDLVRREAPTIRERRI